MAVQKSFMVFGHTCQGREVRFVSVVITEEMIKRGAHYGEAIKKTQDGLFFPIIAVSEDDQAYKATREGKVLVHVNGGVAETYSDEHISVVTYDEDNTPDERENIPDSFNVLMTRAGISLTQQ